MKTIQIAKKSTFIPASLLLCAGIMLLIAIVQSCDEKDETPTPTIEAVSPAAGPVGITVDITGQGFSQNPTENKVTFNGTEAVVTVATPNSLRVLVPNTATTGKVAVQVGDKQIEYTDDFTITSALYSFEPTKAFRGDTIVIKGANFSTDLASNTVTFGTKAATVLEATTTQLKVIVPADAVTDYVTVQTGSNIAVSLDKFAVREMAIVEVTPNAGVPGDEITITGTEFSTNLDDYTENKVYFAGVRGAVEITNVEIVRGETIYQSPLVRLTVTVPDKTITGKITVKYNGSTVESPTDFVSTAPVITSFTPTSGGISTRVTITGLNFDKNVLENNVVNFGGTEATVISATDTEIVVTVPAGTSAGNRTINVIVNDIAAIPITTKFNVLTAVINTFSPLSAQLGAEVTITGENFSTVADENMVYFTTNSSAAVVKSASSTQLVVLVPDDAYDGKIRVDPGTGNGVNSTDRFTVSPATITALSPASVKRGETLTITGTGFGADPTTYLSIYFDDTSGNTGSNGTFASVDNVTPSGKLEVTVPDDAKTGDGKKVTIQLYNGTTESTSTVTVTITR